jgi:hypothetical protein
LQFLAGWSDTEVARRWWMLCPARKTADGQPEQPTQAELDAICSDPQRLAELRGRLSDISWFMRMVAEPIARLANAEDQCSGRFWLAPLELEEEGTPGPQPSVLPTRASDKGFLPMGVEDYLELLDWTGRQTVTGKTGTIPAHLAPVLQRLGIVPEGWCELATGFGRLFHRVAGSPASVAREALRRRGLHRFRNPGGRLLDAASRRG